MHFGMIDTDTALALEAEKPRVPLAHRYHPPAAFAPRDQRHDASHNQRDWVPMTPISAARVTPSPELGAAAVGGDLAHDALKNKKPAKNGGGGMKPGKQAEPRKKQQQQHNQAAYVPVTPPQPAAMAVQPQPVIEYPEIYIYPESLHHITFPVVNYSGRQSPNFPPSPCPPRPAQAPRPQWPTCYLAISPPYARPSDFEAALAPAGYGLVVAARLAHTSRTARLSEFRDAEELRQHAIQLEVWDEEDAIKEASLSGHAADVGRAGPGPGAVRDGAQKKKKKGQE
ncbi:hypothetical protein AAE478_005230 [Parahypoxylon ruwenzoriense]